MMQFSQHILHVVVEICYIISLYMSDKTNRQIKEPIMNTVTARV